MSGLWSRERGACPAFLWAFLKVTIFNLRSLEIFPKTPWTCSSISMNCWRNKYHQICNLVKLAWKQVLAWENAVVRVCKPWPCCFFILAQSQVYIPFPPTCETLSSCGTSRNWNGKPWRRSETKVQTANVDCGIEVRRKGGSQSYLFHLLLIKPQCQKAVCSVSALEHNS